MQAMRSSSLDGRHRAQARPPVVAGGVEDEATLNQLRELGCDAVQGFCSPRPLAAEDVPNWVRESSWARPAREKTSLRRVS
jgi:predicted signal transduction protein with EAL and GGDEF domain